MCGLTGFWQPGNFSADAAQAVAEEMAGRIAHRGPDDAGVWIDERAGVALAHRRLAILDLSPAGHQPMASSCGRHVIVFNGEIYNHLDLRHALEAAGAGPAWRGHSDTETLIAAIAAWGVERALGASVGMFAFAVWDRQAQVLTLARDRMGEKPLYYGWQGETFLFGSELKALKAHPDFNAPIDRGSLALFLRHNYIPAPYSIYRGIQKLPPGSFLEISRASRESSPRTYWSMQSVAESGTADPFSGTDSEAVQGLEDVLTRAIEGQRVADVPLGALLSGGVDSSAVVALMQARASRPVRTFTIGFAEQDYNEAAHAAAVARHLGTEHTEMTLSAKDALRLIPGIPQVYDEPFADSSQLPTQLVMQMARQHVTVALSGDGGDEMFGGYNRYFLAPRAWRYVRPLPMPVRKLLGRAILALPPERWDRLLDALPIGRRPAQAGAKLHKLGHRLLHLRGIDDLYYSLVSEWSRPDEVVLEGSEPPTVLNRRRDWPKLPDDVARMMALDAMTYLPDDILVKVDRAAMATSLETRAPFLDHRVVEYAWRLPMALRIREGQSKWLLRQVLYRYVPKELIERPKMGFGIPLDAWLLGPLRDWAEALLDEDRLRREGYFNPTAIRRIWQAHLVGGQSFGYRLWSVLMFQAWSENEKHRLPSPAHDRAGQARTQGSAR
jgi:asparagine synthase (glutamine-hydrolysing)